MIRLFTGTLQKEQCLKIVLLIAQRLVVNVVFLTLVDVAEVVGQFIRIRRLHWNQLNLFTMIKFGARK